MVGTISNADRTESVLRLAGTTVTTALPAYIRATQGLCSRPSANPEFFKRMIEIPHGWTNVTYHSKFPAVFRQNSVEWTGCGRSRLERRQTNMLLLGRTCSEQQGSI